MYFSHVVFIFNTRRTMSKMTLRKNNVKSWVWIRVSWYIRYRIRCIVMWLRNSLRCHAFFQCVMRLWMRVTWSPIQKYWWSGYRRMYHWFQYLFYFTNIGWIVDWSDVYQIVCNILIRVGVIQINVNRVKISLFQFRIKWVWFQFTAFLHPTFSTLELFSRLLFLKNYCL